MVDHPARPAWTSRERLALGLVLLLGVAIYLAYVDRPLDHRIRSSWRQADYLGIARNFYQEGMNILYPRIDWRGAGPGYAEMEFPALPWLAAALYRVVGYHEQVLRILSALLASASLLLFAALARHILPPLGTVFATAAFALNPLLLHLATAMQPEPLMLFLSLLAIALLWRWADRPHGARGMLLTAAAMGAAILAKATASYLGVIFGYEILRRFGRRALVMPVVYVAALVAILPPLAWYAWGHHFWTDYGNSLGLSNGDHFLTTTMLARPRFLLGILKWETLGVFTPFGWLLALAGLAFGAPPVRSALVWYLATWVLFLPAAKTTSADWAYYYHALAVAPGCLLMGSGVAALMLGRVVPARWGWVDRWQPRAAGLLAAATFATLFGLDVAYVQVRDQRPELLAMRTCTLEFASHVPHGALLVVAGDAQRDQHGRPGAYNISMPFAWMDRKGFNYPADELSIDTLDRIAAEGGRYWMASEEELERAAMRAQAERRYHLLATCQHGYSLYDLSPDRGTVSER